LLKSDQAKLWFLNLVILFSGLFAGIMMINALLFLCAISALIIMTVRFRYTFVALSCLGALALCFAFYGAAMAASFGFLVVIPGLLMGYKTRIFNSPSSIITWGFFPFLLPIGLMIIYYSQLIAQTPFIVSEITGAIELSAASFGIAASELQMLYAAIPEVINWSLRLMPGIFFTLFVSLVFFAYLIATYISQYFGAVVPKMNPLYLWKAGEIWLIPLGLGLLLVLLGNSWPKIVGENLLVFMVHFFAFFGICLIDFYFKKIKVHMLVRLLIYLFVLVAVVVAIPLLAVLGLVDSRFDFRKITLSTDNSNI
jgi:hypothetical protein